MNLLEILAKPSPVIGECYGSKLDIHQRVMLLAHVWANLSSKDPRTKVGAAVYNDATYQLALGYNGFPHGLPDYVALWNNRDRESEQNKYLFVRHAEENAIDKARDMRMDPKTSRMYVTHMPCSGCAKAIIQFGVRAVYYVNDYPDTTSLQLLTLAGIDCRKLQMDVRL